MRFDLKLDEIRYIQKKFHFGNLIGVDKGVLPFLGIEKRLREKGVIRDFGSRAELATEYRYLFSSWENMRYSIVCPEEVEKDDFLCVLVNESEILIVAQVGDDVTIELADFNEEVMDGIIYNISGIADCDSPMASFHITVSADELEQIITAESDSDLARHASKLGIGVDVLGQFVSVINNNDDCTLLLCEDHAKEVGALTKIVNSDKGICALKHVTPKDSAERFVMIMGDAQGIVDSIYVL